MPTTITSSPYAPHWELYPRTYVAPRVPVEAPFVIDGDLTKKVWKNAPWSEPFQDIQGNDAPPDTAHRPADTRFKALWDDDYLYIGALLHPSPDFATQAHFTQRNSPIFQCDSDFEVFVDAMSCNHNYKELEINAINTVWNLLLDKPYRDGGVEHSGRVAQPGQALYWDVAKQQTAVQVLHGQLNDPTGQGALWSVEVALAFEDLLSRYEEPVFNPAVGTLWRINFSRVELKGDVNWTWQNQTVWDAATNKHVGKIDMHLPDAWGYLVFGGDTTTTAMPNDTSANHDTTTTTPRDPVWPARLAAMNVYYALHYYKEQHGSYTTTLKDLNVDTVIVEPFTVDIDVIIDEDDDSFLVRVKGNDDDMFVTVRDDRLLRVFDPSKEDETPKTLTVS